MTEPFIELNYLTVKVDKGTLEFAIRGQEVLHEFTVDLKDMQYKPTEHKFCEHLLTSQESVLSQRLLHLFNLIW